MALLEMMDSHDLDHLIAKIRVISSILKSRGLQDQEPLFLTIFSPQLILKLLEMV